MVLLVLMRLGRARPRASQGLLNLLLIHLMAQQLLEIITLVLPGHKTLHRDSLPQVHTAAFHLLLPPSPSRLGHNGSSASARRQYSMGSKGSRPLLPRRFQCRLSGLVE